MEITPYVEGPFELTEQLSQTDLQQRRAAIERAYRDNSPDPAISLPGRHNPRRAGDYLDETYYFVPLLLALLLQRDHQYVASLDWYRTVYDYSMPTPQREIAYLLGANNNWTNAYDRAEDWLADPLNPHRIAASRPRAYARYTILSLIRCLLDAGDDDYTRDTSESVPRARTYYLTALELELALGRSDNPNACDDLIGEVHLELGEGHFETEWKAYRERLRGLDDRAAVSAAVESLRQVEASNVSDRERLSRVREIVAAAEATARPDVRVASVMTDAAETETQIHTAMLAVPELSRAARDAGRAAGVRALAGVAAAVGTSVAEVMVRRPELPWLIDPPGLVPDDRIDAVAAADQRATFEHRPAAGRGFRAGPVADVLVAANPVVTSLRLHAQMNLYKLRNCQNIAGLHRELEPYTAPTDARSDLPTVSEDGQLQAGRLGWPAAHRLQLRHPGGTGETARPAGGPVRGEHALGRRKERGRGLHRRQGPAGRRADAIHLRLADVRIDAAAAGVQLAELQVRRAETATQHWTDLLDAGVSSLEQASIDLLYVATGLYTAASIASTTAAVWPSPEGAASFGASNISSIAQAFSSAGQAVSTGSQILGLSASYERRAQDWQYQRELSRADERIASQSVIVAQLGLAVSREERAVAGLEYDHAVAGLEFLTNKFTNQELYEWMGGVWEQIYRWFLRQATATAQLAANQLGFERQEVPPPFIQADYWEMPAATAPDARPPDRRGLTGSARLLQDIYQLDQHAFDKNARKLHLTKTLSLGQMAPLELQRFRHTGVLPFATILEMFDRDFPGHYLRLIKKVRTSIVALVPPSQGIRATLSSTGSSRAVIGGGTGPMRTVVVRRDPQQVALSSAQNATGVFDLDPQPELLMPFEGLGVETHWELRMPKAANPFDYNSIADVLVSIDYTALHNEDQAERVKRELGRNASYDRAFSFTRELSDAWNILSKPKPGAALTAAFTTTRADFAPNLTDLSIQHVTLMFTLSDGPALTITVDHLRLLQKGQPPAGGGGSTTDGLISTRRGNANWSTLQGREPIGEWELALPNTAEARAWFTGQRIIDILVVLTYSGRTPEWPA